MKSSEEIRNQLAALKAEVKLLEAERSLIEPRLKEIDERLKKLKGTGFGRSHGEIGWAERELAEAELNESDSKLMTVMTSGYSRDPSVVRRVTKKSIFLARKGCTRESRYDRETGVGSGSTIIPEDLKRIKEKYGVR